jgi:hypothetical protein
VCKELKKVENSAAQGDTPTTTRRNSGLFFEGVLHKYYQGKEN